MQQRTLGQQGLTVSALGYGAMGVTSFYGPGDSDVAADAVRRAYDLGVTFFDTAEMYGWGEGERFLGRAVKGFRDDVVIASKFGFTPEFGRNSRPDHVREVIDNSLRHLGVDHLDVVYQHRVDPEVPIEDVAGAVKEFVDAGKVRYFGLCEAGPQTIRRAHDVMPVSVLQTEYSLFAREVESVLPALDELGIGFVPYSPLARGFLAGGVGPAESYDRSDARATGMLQWWAPENFDRNHAIVRRLSAVAESKGATLAQLALAWLLSRGEHVVPIPGSRNPDRVAENLEAAELVLGVDDLVAIDEAIGDGPYGSSTAEAATWI